VTPVDFAEPAADQGENFGAVVSSDATGESDGEPGVDGSEISWSAPGAAHRPTDVGQALAEARPAEGTGLDQAADAAAVALPGDAGTSQAPPSTTPDAVADAPEAPPATMPDLGDPATGAAGTSHRPG